MLSLSNALLSLTLISGGLVHADPKPSAKPALSEDLSNFPHNSVKLEEFFKYVEAGKVPILDARRLSDYQAGHVPGAIHLEPGADFYHNFKKLEPKLGPYRDRLIFIYCADQWCGIADNLWLQLVAQGFQKIVRFPGGWLEWQQAKLPEETKKHP